MHYNISGKSFSNVSVSRATDMGLAFSFFSLKGANCITLRRENTSFLFVPILTVRLSLVFGGGTQHLFLPSFLLPNCGVRSQKKLFRLVFLAIIHHIKYRSSSFSLVRAHKGRKGSEKSGENAVVGEIKAEKPVFCQELCVFILCNNNNGREFFWSKAETLNNYRENGELKGKAAATKPRISLLPRRQKHLAFANTHFPPFAV